MNDKQFKGDFKLAGGWFIIEYLETIYNNLSQLTNDKVFIGKFICRFL